MQFVECVYLGTGNNGFKTSLLLQNGFL